MLRVAIIGAGGISQAHISGYLEFPNRCKIVALVDIYPEKCEEKKLRYELKDAEIYDDYKKILDREDIDLIDICTPPYVHSEIAINSLSAGRNVLVEKPMKMTRERISGSKSPPRLWGRPSSEPSPFSNANAIAGKLSEKKLT